MLFPRLPPEYAGGSLQGVRLMEQMARRGVEVTALASVLDDVDAPARESAYGGEVRRFRAPRGLQARMFVGGLRTAWWLATNSNWDILHLHGYSYHGVLPIVVALLKGRPVLIKTTMLMQGSNALPQGTGRLKQFLLSPYQRAGAIVALSEEIEASLLRDTRLRAKVVRISNGVDTDLFRPARGDDERAELRRSFGIPERGFVVATCGMIDPRKNGLALLEAGARLRSRPVYLVVAGPPGPDPAHMRRVEAAIAALPEAVEAHLLGNVEPDRIADAVRCADVLTLTSRAEGMPNSLLEGMATALPSIATDIPGSRDVLADGGGVLVPLDDLDALAGEIDRLLEDPAERKRLGDDAKRLCDERHSAARIAERYLELYAELLDAESG